MEDLLKRRLPHGITEDVKHQATRNKNQSEHRGRNSETVLMDCGLWSASWDYKPAIILGGG